MRTRHIRTHAAACALAALVLCVIGSAAPAEEGQPCPDGEERIGHLGILETTGSSTIFLSPDGTLASLRFMSEPEIVSVDPNGPCGGILQSGDVLVAIDGHLITTERGGSLFANPPTDRPVELLLRSDGSERRVSIVPISICPDDESALYTSLTLKGPAMDIVTGVPTPGPIPLFPHEPDPEEPPSDPVLESVWHPTWWLGFGLRCSMTGTLEPIGGDGTAPWRFTTTPKIISIDPGSPADKSELRIGDTIKRIDGIPIDTDEATLRIGEIKTGDEIHWTIRRGLRTLTIPMVAEMPSPFAPDIERRIRERIRERVAQAAIPESALSPVRFVGNLGQTGIEVRGPDRTQVLVEDGDDEIEIIVGDTTIRIWKVEEDWE